MALTICKECKAQISTTAAACPQCGAKRPKTSGCAMVAAGFFGLVFLLSIVHSCSSDSSIPPQSSTAPDQTTPVASAKTDPAAVLAESKVVVDEIDVRFKSNAEKLKKYYGSLDEVKQATDDLIKLAVVKGLYENSAKSEEKSLASRADQLISGVSQQQRMLYASAMEETFVKNGMDVKVTAGGTKKDQLRIKYVLMSKPLVYKFQNDMKLEEQARLFGFKKVIYTDGFDSTWTVTP